MANMFKREPQELTGPGGDQPELRVLYIDNGDGTYSMAVSAVALPLPTGAATSAKQDTTNIKLDSLIAAVQSISGGPTASYSLVQKNTAGDASYKFYGYATVNGDWFIKRINKTTNYAEFISGLAGTSTFGAGFLTWVQGLTPYDDFWDIF